MFFGDKLAEIFAAWVQMLPLEYDEVEARACHKHLCSFITRNNPHVFGNNLSNLPHLLVIFATILDSSDDEEERLIEEKSLVINILKQMKLQMGDHFMQAFHTLESDLQQTISQSLAQ